MLSSRRSSSPKMRLGSECTVAIAPTSRRPISSGAAITEWTVTSAYCPERPSHVPPRAFAQRQPRPRGVLADVLARHHLQLLRLLLVNRHLAPRYPQQGHGA